MIISLTKQLLFAAVVLLVGQIRLGDRTLAGRFQGHVLDAWSWSQKKIESSSLYETLAKVPWVGDWASRRLKEAGRSGEIKIEIPPIPGHDRLSAIEQRSLHDLLE